MEIAELNTIATKSDCGAALPLPPNGEAGEALPLPLPLPTKGEAGEAMPLPPLLPPKEAEAKGEGGAALLLPLPMFEAKPKEELHFPQLTALL